MVKYCGLLLNLFEIFDSTLLEELFYDFGRSTIIGDDNVFSVVFFRDMAELDAMTLVREGNRCILRGE